MTRPSSSIMLVVQQTVDYLGAKYACLPHERQTSLCLQDIHSAMSPQWDIVSHAALAGDLLLTKATCRQLIAAYRLHLQW